MDTVQFVLAFCLGLGLSAACGFRVFIPPLAMSVAAMNGVLDLSPDWQWVGSPLAVIILGAATLIEILAYLIPWVSNALDSVELIAAPIAGMLVTASSLAMAGDMNPVVLWVIAAIVGGGTAELVEGTSAMGRLAVAGATGGAGGPVVGIIEMLTSAVLSLLAILAPVFALIVVCGLVIYCWRRARRIFARRRRSQDLGDF
ncbi:MAG: DUF4126 domain-containing protein [Cyanobacteria bacterium P01_F01_bin.86]